jgi:hypothetical protein
MSRLATRRACLPQGGDRGAPAAAVGGDHDRVSACPARRTPRRVPGCSCEPTGLGGTGAHRDRYGGRLGSRLTRPFCAAHPARSSPCESRANSLSWFRTTPFLRGRSPPKTSLARVFKVAARAGAESAAVAVIHAPATGELCVLSARAKISAWARSDARGCRFGVGTAPRWLRVACRVGLVQGAREPVRSAPFVGALRGATAQVRSSAYS